jgi:outer membrane protein assembly factor BamE (lipoprotein component of BamABCDE complex)
MGSGGGIGRSSGRSLAAIVTLTVLLAACSPQYRFHGYMPAESELATVTVGQSTREDVVAMVGAPTAMGVIEDDAFYYVQSRFRDYGYRATQEVERQLLKITFAPSGVVQNIERYGLEDGNVVALSRRVTDDNLRDTTFIRQLLGNVGQFDAGQFIGEE